MASTIVESSITITYCEYKNNYGSTGGIFAIYNYFEFELYSSTFDSNYAENGAIMNIQMISTISTNSKIRVSQNEFKYSNASDTGGIASISHSMLDAMFDNNDYLENEGVSGGIFYITDCTSMNLMEENFLKSEADFGRIVYSIATDFDFAISDSLVEWKEFDYDTHIEYVEDNDDEASTSFYFTGSGTTIVSRKNHYTHNNLAKKGGVYQMNNVNFADYGSKFYNNSALYGGAISCQECIIELDASVFSENYGKYGGALYLESESYLLMSDIEFSYNDADNSGGCLFITTRS